MSPPTMPLQNPWIACRAVEAFETGSRHGVLCEGTFRWRQGFSILQDWRSHIRLGTLEGA